MSERAQPFISESLAACPPKPSLQQRHLLNPSQAQELAGLFKLLAGETRLRLLHTLVREGQICVNDLAERVGMKPQAVSNQLQRLADRGIVSTSRNGNQILYRIVDLCVVSLLEEGLCLLEDSTDRGTI